MAASLEMQLAAQAISTENQRLRSFISLLGVPSKDIDTYLAASDHEAGVKPSACSKNRPSAGSFPTSHSSQFNQSNLGHQPNLGFFSPSFSTVSTLPGDAVLGAIPILQDATEISAKGKGEHSQARTVVRGAASMLPEVSDCFYPQDPHQSHPRNVSISETSCDVAAAILLELHNQSDPAQVRVALGCKGRTECSVKNTKIFHLIDNIP